MSVSLIAMSPLLNPEFCVVLLVNVYYCVISALLNMPRFIIVMAVSLAYCCVFVNVVVVIAQTVGF